MYVRCKGACYVPDQPDLIDSRSASYQHNNSKQHFFFIDMLEGKGDLSVKRS